LAECWFRQAQATRQPTTKNL